jgi:excisionase family DNA binding protein
MPKSKEQSTITQMYLSVDEVAKLVGCGTSTIWSRAKDGLIPKPYKFGTLTRWKLTEIEAAFAPVPT